MIDIDFIAPQPKKSMKILKNYIAFIVLWVESSAKTGNVDNNCTQQSFQSHNSHRNSLFDRFYTCTSSRMKLLAIIMTIIGVKIMNVTDVELRYWSKRIRGRGEKRK